MIEIAKPLFMSASQVMSAEEKKLSALQASFPKAVESQFSAHIKACWTDAYEAKTDVQARDLAAARMVRAEYDPAVKAAIMSETDGSIAFIPAVSIKVAAARDYILDIYRSTDKPWTIKPTPVPELPEDLFLATVQRVQQEVAMSQVPLSDEDILALDERARKEVTEAINEVAVERAERMEKKIYDSTVEGEWFESLTEVIDDIVTYSAGVMKGYVLRMKPKIAYENGKVVVKYKLVREYERVSPFDFYTQRNIRKVNDGYCIERLRLNRRKLTEMKGVKGYSDKEIDAVLAEYGNGTINTNWMFSSTDSYADEAAERDSLMTSPEGRIDGLEFWGSVSGQWLLDWGMDASKVPDPSKEYQVTAILIGSHIIRAAINPHPLGYKPYHMVSWSKNPDSVWGRGIPEIVKDIQAVLNATVRALVNNVAMASGPQIAVDYALVRVGEDISKIRPWKVIQLDSTDVNESGLGGRSGNQLPISFFQPTMQASVLLEVINAFMRFMDEYTGIPSYTHGAVQESGAGATSSGLAMLMTAQGKIIKNVTARIDMLIVEPTIEDEFLYIMQYDDDDSIKGDAYVVAKGTGSLIAKEQKLIRLRELMAETKNDVALQVIGLPGYAELMKRVFHAYDLDLEGIIPDIEELITRDMGLQAGIMAKGMPQTANLAQPGPQTLDVAGAPSQGQDNNVFTMGKVA